MNQKTPKLTPPNNKEEKKDLKAILIIWFTKIKSIFLTYPRAASAIVLGLIFILVISTAIGGSPSSSSMPSSNPIPSSSTSLSETSSSSSVLQEVTLTFDTQGGTSISPLTGLPGASINASLLTTTKVGHNFVAFSTSLLESDALSLLVFPNESMTIYALWDAEQFNVNYYGVASVPIDVHSAGLNFDTHSFVVTLDGFLLAWGDNSSKQLSNTVNEASVNQPVDITSGLGLVEDETVTQARVVAGSFADGSSVILTSNGRVLTFGANDVGQLGNGTTSAYEGTPQDITANFALAQDERILSFDTAINVVYAYTNMNRYFAWGFGANGQTTIPGRTQLSNVPVLVDFPTLGNFAQNETVSALFLDYYNGFILTTANRVFGWGASSWGQLPLQNTHVSSLTDFTSNYVLSDHDVIESISVGARHTIVQVFDTSTFKQKILSHGVRDSYVGFSSIRGGSTYYDNQPYDITALVGLQDDEAIISIHAGGYYTYFLLNTNELVEITKTNGTVENRIQTLVNVIDGNQLGILNFMVGPSKTFFLITYAYNLFTWGSNLAFSLGIGNTNTSFNQSTPVNISGRLGTPFLLGVELADYGVTIPLMTPVLSGFAFAGWFEDRYLTIPYVEKTMPLNDIDLYASWVASLS